MKGGYYFNILKKDCLNCILLLYFNFFSIFKKFYFIVSKDDYLTFISIIVCSFIPKDYVFHSICPSNIIVVIITIIFYYDILRNEIVFILFIRVGSIVAAVSLFGLFS